ncbi:hypothetical protein BYT27DRAFT_7255377 [Phlegmacium glaucopus]|nr:hypothetical protein BYT27DRAFT_7255377 [Phlegmacium glaucopus]
MPLPILPLEVLSMIFVYLEDLELAQEIPQVFWAIAPHSLRRLCIGWNLSSTRNLLQSQLVQIYPNCGHFVEQLTLMTDHRSAPTITAFLEQFPPYHKIRHLTLSDSNSANSFWSPTHMPYQHG